MSCRLAINRRSLEPFPSTVISTTPASSYSGEPTITMPLQSGWMRGSWSQTMNRVVVISPHPGACLPYPTASLASCPSTKLASIRRLAVIESCAKVYGTPATMSAQACPECDRLWRELGEVAQRNFRLEERLRCAEDRQDHDLGREWSEKLGNLAREQLRVPSIDAQSGGR